MAQPQTPDPVQPPAARANTKLIFPGLGGMRGIAASIVVLNHLNLTVDGSPRFNEIGRVAVRFFFVLSGFLITYLLRAEQAASGTINIKSFYWRRVLRIWPPYFIGLAIAFFILPKIALLPGVDLTLRQMLSRTLVNFNSKLLLFLFFCPNVSSVIFPRGVVGANQYWSLGVEEQFYAIWPLVMSLARGFHRWIMVGVVGVKLVSWFVIKRWFFSEHRGQVLNFLEDFNIECMAIGGLAAVLLTDRPSWVSRFRTFFRSHRWMMLPVVCLLLASSFSLSKDPLKIVLEAVLAGAIILLVGYDGGSAGWLNARWLVALGRWSYGMYVYHIIVLILCEMTLRALMNADGPMRSYFIVGLFVSTYALTVALSALSSRWFESYFLRLKNHFHSTRAQS